MPKEKRKRPGKSLHPGQKEQLKKKKLNIKASDDIRKYIKITPQSAEGDAEVKYSIDEEQIAEQEQYDGFYAVCTSLTKEQKSVREILAVNRRRLEIEESFCIMKTEFKARPVYVSRKDCIKAHFLICFIAIAVLRLLKVQIDAAEQGHYSAEQIIKTLREMQVCALGKHYTGSFERTALTDILHSLSSTRFDCKLISQGEMIRQLR